MLTIKICKEFDSGSGIATLAAGLKPHGKVETVATKDSLLLG